MLHFCNFHMQCSNDTRRITIHNESTSKALRVLNGGSRAKLSILNSSCFFPEGYRNVRCFFSVLSDLVFTLKCNKPNSMKRENNYTTKNFICFPPVDTARRNCI